MVDFARSCSESFYDWMNQTIFVIISVRDLENLGQEEKTRDVDDLNVTTVWMATVVAERVEITVL